MQKPVGQRRFPMVNMGDDAEISNMCCVHLIKSEQRRIRQIRAMKRKFAGGFAFRPERPMVTSRIQTLGCRAAAVVLAHLLLNINRILRKD
jgi:hypothetical protein